MNIYEAFTFFNKVINLQGFYFSLHDINTQPTKSFRIILSIIYHVLLTGILTMTMYKSQISDDDDAHLFNGLKGSTSMDNLIFFFFLFSRTVMLSILHLIVLVTIFTRNQRIVMLFKLLKSFDDTCVGFLQTKRLNEKYSKVINAVSIIFIGHFTCNNIYIYVHSGSSFKEKALYMVSTVVHLNLKSHILIMVFLLGTISIRLNAFLMILKSKTSIQSQSEFNLLIKLYKQFLEMIQIYNRLFGVPLTLQIISLLMDILAVVSSTYTQFNLTKFEMSVEKVGFAAFNLIFFIPSIVSVVSLMYIADHIYELVKEKLN